MDPASAVGVAAASIQFLEVCIKITSRLKEFSNSIDDAPESFRKISTTLPAITLCFQRFQSQLNDEPLKSSSSIVGPVLQNALRDVVRL